jgi:hypothetical protein
LWVDPPSGNVEPDILSRSPHNRLNDYSFHAALC